MLLESVDGHNPILTFHLLLHHKLLVHKQIFLYLSEDFLLLHLLLKRLEFITYCDLVFILAATVQGFHLRLLLANDSHGAHREIDLRHIQRVVDRYLLQ